MGLKLQFIQLDQIVKGGITFFLALNLYCSYLFIQNGLFFKVSQSHPLIITQIVFYVTIALYYIALKKKKIVVGLFAILFSIISYCILEIAKKAIIQFFDPTKSCEGLVQANPVYELFIDRNFDYYFDQTSSILCSHQCPCKWMNKTEIYNNNPKRFNINKYDGAKSAYECPNFLSDIEMQAQKIKYLKEMIQLEVTGCSGYCTKKDFYSITDINMGTPKKTCFDVNRGIQKRSHRLLFMSIYSISLLMLILVPSTCYLIFQFYKEKILQANNLGQIQKEFQIISSQNNLNTIESQANINQNIKDVKKIACAQKNSNQMLEIQRITSYKINPQYKDKDYLDPINKLQINPIEKNNKRD